MIQLNSNLRRCAALAVVEIKEKRILPHQMKEKKKRKKSFQTKKRKLVQFQMRKK